MVKLRGKIDLTKVAGLLPVTQSLENGSIQGVKYNNIIRGQNKNRKPMRSMCTIGITMPDQQTGQLSTRYFKFGPSVVHVSGLKDNDLAYRTTFYLVTHLQFLQDMMTKFPQEEHLKAITWLANNSTSNQQELAQMAYTGGLDCSHFSLIHPTSAPPSDVNAQLVEIYKRPLSCFSSWKEYLEFLMNFCQDFSLFSGDLAIVDLQTANYARNYPLGTNIDRINVGSSLQASGIFRAIFDNRVRTSVRAEIYCPCVNKPHVFSIESSGSVMQSSPCNDHAYSSYCHLINTLRQYGCI